MPLVSADALSAHYDVCVVGTGPGGLSCGLGCFDRGLKVLMLEAGGKLPIPGNPDVLAADIVDGAWHDPTDIVAASALGGTSHWWGGRSVPFDPIDFRDWPIAYDDMLPWYDDAASFLGAKALISSPPPERFARLRNFDAAGEETWCPQINMAKRWNHRLSGAQGPAIVLGARATGLIYNDGKIESLRVRVGSETRVVKADQVVLACGGLGGLKLLMLAQTEYPEILGGVGGPLGLNYMGHITGSVANLAFANEQDSKQFAYHDIGDGICARRRLRTRDALISEKQIPNTAFWIDDAYKENPSHLSSIASAKYLLALAVRKAASRGKAAPGIGVQDHLRNIARAPVSAALGLSRAGYLHLRSRVTGHLPRPNSFMPAEKGAWHMRYHAEQRPDPRNRISLSPDLKDSVGLPKLRIDFRFSKADCEAVVRAHEALDADLQQSGAGRLSWLGDRQACVEMVSGSARDGYHQMGGAVMTKDPQKGIVDPECRAHGIDNLWIASSSVFPTGSQANPTLTIAALGRRIAARLAAGATRLSSPQMAKSLHSDPMPTESTNAPAGARA